METQVSRLASTYAHTPCIHKRAHTHTQTHTPLVAIITICLSWFAVFFVLLWQQHIKYHDEVCLYTCTTALKQPLNTYEIC